MAITKLNVYSLGANSVDSDHYVDTSIDNAHLADDAVGIAELSATGTASSSTFLRGDNAWAEVGGAYSSWIVKDADGYTASDGDQIICNAPTTAFTITLPSGTTVGRTVTISNIGAATVTVARNSQPINSTASDATLLTNRSTQLVYVTSTIGWKELP
jgi:hypothetical protein